MDMRKYGGSSFLKVADLKASGPVQLEIAGVAEGQYGKPNLVFTDGSKLSLNTTNNGTLVRTFGSESESWIGKQVTLMHGKTNYQGTPTDTIVVTATSRGSESRASARPAFNKAPPKPDEDMDDAIPF